MPNEEDHEDDALLLYPEDAEDEEDSEEEDENGNDAADDDNDSVDSDMTLEPSCDKANRLPFAKIVYRMEKLWEQRRKKQKVKDEEKKKYLLPTALLRSMEPQSIFPLLRLLVPDQDNARNCLMKEKTIAQAYCDAEGFSKGTTNHEMLFGYTDPQKVPHTMAGDLSLVVQHVLEQRMPNTPSRCTVGQINQYLDDLAGMRQAQRGVHNHDWRESQSATTTSAAAKKKKKKQPMNVLRQQWLRKVMNKGGLSPLEHKWLVRILLQKMEFGLAWRALFTWYSPYAIELWNSHNSLKKMCDKLADPDYSRQRRREERALERDRNNNIQSTLPSQWQPQALPADLGNTISPMLSNKCQFETCMSKLEENHKDFLKSSKSYQDGQLQQRLSLKFPAICAEIKLDGERMVVHHSSKDGTVTMQTRNAKWYSQLYSPGLAPCIRKALQKYRVDVILDGEIESWDNGRQELIPFGNNRTVANCRKQYLARHNQLDPRDLNLHADNLADASIRRAADESKFVTQSATKIIEGGEDPGKECWLQFIVFDILYVGGPDANKLFADCGLIGSDKNNNSKTVARKGGSIIHLTLLERKMILYHLIEEQPKEVELCQAMIIRPNGDILNGREYFRIDKPLMEFGHKITVLDSTLATISGEIPNLEDLDRRRRQGKSDMERSRTRAQAVDDFYRKVVEENRFEGLVFKDLAAPYLFGETGRKRKHWHKFKPDYDKAAAVDVDVVIVGGYFATGLRHSGKLSHFLCACLDSDNPTSYLTLCKVNGASVNYDRLDKLLEETGFSQANKDNGQETQLGKWFQQGEGEDPVPSFVSSRSLQRGPEDFDGWKFNKSKNYPDLWIHPDDSIVLTIYGQELVESEEYSAGIALRFARISKIRHDAVDGDEKKASEVDNDKDLWHKYLENLNQRQGYASASQDQSAENTAGTNCRFMTPDEYNRRNTRKRRRKAPLSPSKQIPKVEQKVSDTLSGLCFTVLEGNYHLDETSPEAQEGKEEGWYNEATKINRAEDVMQYILSHGGVIRASAENSDSSGVSTDKCYVLGGIAADVRVTKFMKAIEYAKSQEVDNPKTKKAIRLKAMAANDGVLKWTFAFSLVYQKQKYHRLIERSETAPSSVQSVSFLEATNGVVVPKAHNYIARSKAKERVAEEILNLDNAADVTKAELIMALLDVESRADADDFTPRAWQSRGFDELSASERVILPPHACPLWRSDSKGCVIYPDVFRDGYETSKPDKSMNFKSPEEGDSERWQDLIEDAPHHILAALPIARAMGAVVSTHLHTDVSHIVCDLKDKHKDSVLTQQSVALEDFNDSARGEKLLKHLQSDHFDQATVSLIHPKWVRRRWSLGNDEIVQ